jgi:hypothetical protein
MLKAAVARKAAAKSAPGGGGAAAELGKLSPKAATPEQAMATVKAKKGVKAEAAVVAKLAGMAAAKVAAAAADVAAAKATAANEAEVLKNLGFAKRVNSQRFLKPTAATQQPGAGAGGKIAAAAGGGKTEKHDPYVAIAIALGAAQSVEEAVEEGAAQSVEMGVSAGVEVEQSTEKRLKWGVTVGPGKHDLPRHRHAFPTLVSRISRHHMTWRAIYGRPWFSAPAAAVGGAAAVAAAAAVGLGMFVAGRVRRRREEAHAERVVLCAAGRSEFGTFYGHTV